MWKKTVNIFLIVLLSVQMLPVRQMGCMLFSNQFTEEIPHSPDVEKDCCKKSSLKNDFILTGSFTILSPVTYLFLQRPVIAEAIPFNHTADIHVPPPNC